METMLIAGVMGAQARKNPFRQSLTEVGAFAVAWELVPGRGDRETEQDKVLAAATLAAKG